MKDLLKDIIIPFSLIALALGLGLLFIARRQISNAEALTGHRRDAVAQVTKKHTHTTMHSQELGRPREGITTYIVEYEFTHPDTGKVWSGSADVAKEVWDGMEVGRHYQVIFSEEDPGLSSLFEGDEFKAGAVLANTLGQSLSLLGLCGLVLGFWLKRH
jgi:hypothetical protein